MESIQTICGDSDLLFSQQCNRVPKCDVTKAKILEDYNFGLKFRKSSLK